MKFKLKSNDVNQNIINLICNNRGIDFKDLPMFLNPTSQVINNPSNYTNMVLAAKKIIKFAKLGKKILVLVDSDADGYCSAAMMINYLIDVLKVKRKDIFIVLHEDKQHGITDKVLNIILNSDVDLVLVPDAGSNDIEQHKILKENGKTVIVIDHHEIDLESKEAIIVNNQRKDNKLPNKTLSGGGMVLKLLETIDVLINDLGNSERYYDLAAVSIIADSMEIKNPETRYYVQKGLRNINNPLLKELFKNREVVEIETVSFDAAPSINAFTRVGTMEEKVDLFKAFLGIDEEREIKIRGKGTFNLKLCEYIQKLSSRIKSRQTNQIDSDLKNQDTKLFVDEESPVSICILHKEATKNLTGLIGNRLVETYNKPAIVLKDMSNGILSGSGRTTETFENFRGYINDLGLFEFAQGHMAAFGCSLKEDKLQDFINKIKGQEIDSGCAVVDKAYFDNVSAFEILEVGNLKDCWSKGFEKPKFYIKLGNLNGATFEVKGQKRDTIKISHNYITYIKFKCTEEEIKEFESLNIQEVEIVGYFDVNEWNERCYPQVIIEKLQLHGTDKKNEIQVDNSGFSFSNFQNFTWNN
ncbi:hypothetical protein C0L75_03200 [Clostridium perfringens]